MFNIRAANSRLKSRECAAPIFQTQTTTGALMTTGIQAARIGIRIGDENLYLILG